MQNYPLVSVVTPSYNQSGFLEHTIQSVLLQNYTPIEYLIVDGGSTDGCADIIQKYADQLAWWVSEPDNGQADAINKGLGHAKGEIIAWLNSDDLYLPGAVSRAVTFLQDNPQLSMVFGDAITIDEQGRPLNKLRFGNWGLAELIRFRIICQPAVFMRRSVLESAGVEISKLLDPAFHFMLDHHLWIRIAQYGPIQYIGNGSGSILAAARHHKTAKNVAQAPGFGRETLELLAWIQNQPDLSQILAANRRQVLGGAYRLNARYLLDGDLPGASLLSYVKALAAWPGYALKHWHRMLYALLDLSGLGNPANRLRTGTQTRKRRQLISDLKQQFPKIDPDNLGKWPGLNLEI